MINDLLQRQILALSNEGLTSNQISAELQCEEGLVKLALGANNAGSAEDRDITDAQLALLRQRAFSLAFCEDDSVSAQMTKWLIERDKPKITGHTGIQLVNQVIIQAQERFEALKTQFSTDIPVTTDDNKQISASNS